jgi:uncharacterized protein (DUF486 family)
MRNVSLTILLLCFSNVFMTFAWYAHLRLPRQIRLSASFAI